jgi:hypothetical protein
VGSGSAAAENWRDTAVSSGCMADHFAGFAGFAGFVQLLSAGARSIAAGWL